MLGSRDHGSTRARHIRLVSDRRATAPEGNSHRHHRGEIRSAQQEVFLEAAKLVLTGDPIEIARRLHERAERTVRPT